MPRTSRSAAAQANARQIATQRMLREDVWRVHPLLCRRVSVLCHLQELRRYVCDAARRGSSASKRSTNIRFPAHTGHPREVRQGYASLSFALHHHATTPRSPPSQTPQQHQLQRQTEGEEEEEEEERDSDASRSRGEAALQQQLSALFFAFSALLHDDSFAEGGLRHPNIQILVTVGVDGLLSTPLSLLVKDRLLTRDTLSGLRAELSAQLQRLLVRGPSSRLEGPHPASLPPVVHQTGTHSAASPDAPVGGGTGEPLSPARAAVRASAVAAPLAHSSSSSSSGGSTPSTSTTYRGTPEPRRLCLEAVVLNCLHVCTYGWMAGWMDGCVLCIWWNCFEFRVLKTHTANKVHKRSPLLRNVVSPRPLPLA
eukprot:GHVU01215247.1.p1 GENE.GHVU01215247.1~~GHVU01215247.1.p1  ORF type:complete len:369 (-),score=55.31 GHVU01215247.1:234-1340(-)